MRRSATQSRGVERVAVIQRVADVVERAKLHFGYRRLTQPGDVWRSHARRVAQRLPIIRSVDDAAPEQAPVRDTPGQTKRE
jgi:hypothetical protein